MPRLQTISITLLIFFLFLVFKFPWAEEKTSNIAVTPAVTSYAMNTVKPILDKLSVNDPLSCLLEISRILTDSKTGIQINKIEPGTFMTYDLLDKIMLGFIVTWGLSPEQSNILTSWHEKYMHSDPANVFFAPSANDIITFKAAFGCSHYARSFLAVSKALGLAPDGKELRYTVSCTAEAYNFALDQRDYMKTINGHQFVLFENHSQWYALNTSKNEWTAMPEDFSPDKVVPPHNIPVRFKSYPDVTFLLRKVGKDAEDDCRDGTRTGLMNIYRSGDENEKEFKWERYSGGEAKKRD